MINYDKERGVHVAMSRHTSELLIEKAHRTDSGNYTCAPSNAQPASITVHVLNSTQGKYEHFLLKKNVHGSRER